MHILVINGSPAGKGNTYHVAERLEAAVKQLDEQIEFEYLHLRDCHLEMCKGCYACLCVGEDKCPIHDDRQMIEQKMTEADGVIFMSPVYVLNVTGLFKNFLDRFAYICHRPRFHGKKAWFISTTGALGSSLVTRICSMSVASWGFETMGRLGIITSKVIPKEEKTLQWEAIDQSVNRMAIKMVKQLHNKSLPRASFYKLCAFNMQQASFGHSDPAKADYKYWKSKGWLEPNCTYFIPAKNSPIIHLLANITAHFMIKRPNASKH